MERTYEFVVEAPRDEVFRLLGDARNLNLVTPEWFSFEILRHEPDRMEPGTEIEYWLRWRFLRVRWCSRVTEWMPSERFTYEQARGPFRSFSHEHLFFDDPGGTRVVDRLRYAPPGGSVSDRLFVGADLERIFAFRSDAVRRALSRLPSVGALALAD
jgi:ligand-binding SRPBCC domain-containing protein